MKPSLLLLSLLVLPTLSLAQEPKPADPAPAPAVPAPAPAAPDAAASDVAKVKIGVLPAQMKYDKTEFEVKAGQKVMLLLENKTCPLQHNICILKPGSKDKVAMAAMQAVADPNFMKNNCMLDIPEILVKGNKLVGIGQSDLLEFTAPAAGDYPYLCTFPGHAMLMFGVMHVK